MPLIASENLLKKDIANFVGRPIRTIQYWTDLGLVIPDIAPSRGKGKSRIYSPRNLLEFAMIDVMSNNLKIALETIKYVLECLRESEDFDDFYNNPAYGNTRELIFMTHFDFTYDKGKQDIIKEEPYLRFKIIFKDKNGLFSYPPELGFGTTPPLYSQILFLGHIKNMAESIIESYFKLGT